MTRGRTLGWALGLPVVLAVAAVAGGEATGWAVLQRPLQQALADAAGVAITVESPFRLRLIGSPRLSVGRLVVAPAHALPVPHLADAREVTLRWNWRDIRAWRAGGALRLQSVQARSLDAHLLRLPDARASWQIGPPDAPDATAAPPVPRPLPRFGELQVRQAWLRLDDRPLQTRVDLQLQGVEGEALPAGAAAGYRASARGHHRGLPLDLQVTSGGVLPLVQEREPGDPAPAVPLGVAGRVGVAQLQFEGEAGALLGPRRLNGSLRFSGPSLGPIGTALGLTLPQTPPFDIQGLINHADGVWQLQADRLAVGRSRLNGDFRFDTRAQPGRLTGRLSGPRLALRDLAPAVGRDGQVAPAPGRVLPPRVFDLPSLRAMDADLQVAVEALDLGTPGLAPLADLHTRVRLQGGVLRLEQLRAGVAGGQVTGMTGLDARQVPARWDLDLSFTAVDVAGWLRAVRTPAGEAKAGAATPSAAALRRDRRQARQQAQQGVRAPPRAYLTGVLNGHIKATGAGRSTAEILGSLDGQAQLSLRDGTLSHLATEALGLDIAEALGVVIRGDKPLPLRCAYVDLVLQRGVVRPRTAVVDNADSTVRLAGQIDLGRETLDLQVVTRPKDFSPLALRSPIRVRGTLAAPVVGIESGRLASRVLGALALGAAAGPLAGALPLVDPGTDERRDPCATR